MLGFQGPWGREGAGKGLFLDGVREFICHGFPALLVFWIPLGEGQGGRLFGVPLNQVRGKKSFPVSRAPGILSVVPCGGERVVGGTEEVGVGLCTHWCPPGSLWTLHSSLESTPPVLHPTADCNIS